MATAERAAEQRVLLHGISWETYECLLKDHEDSSAPRFTYDRGELEIMSPLPDHERYKRLLESLVLVTDEELGLDVYSLGSTTFRREDLQQGFEADSCFYFENEEQVRGKHRLDMRLDPPPDLVIEIDITHLSYYKLPIYAAFGVPEVWRCQQDSLEILALAGDRYAMRDGSGVLPTVTASALLDLVRESEGLREMEWIRMVRRWARELGGMG